MAENRIVKCGACYYEFEHGVTVCQGCIGYVVYGATIDEKRTGAKIGAMTWGGGCFVVLYALPAVINSQFHLTMPTGWDGGLWTFGIVIAFGFWGAITGWRKIDFSNRHLIRTFPR